MYLRHLRKNLMVAKIFLDGREFELDVHENQVFPRKKYFFQHEISSGPRSRTSPHLDMVSGKYFLHDHPWYGVIRDHQDAEHDVKQIHGEDGVVVVARESKYM